MNTAGNKALTFINEALAAKKTVYISTMTNVVSVTARNVATWAKANRPLFKLVNGDLYIGAGKSYNKLTSGDMALVGIRAA